MGVIPPASTGLAPGVRFTLPAEFSVFAYAEGLETQGVIGYPAGGSGDLSLRYDVAFTGEIAALKPEIKGGCYRHGGSVDALRVDDVTATTGDSTRYRQVGEQKADYRKWVVTCPNGMAPQPHQAWVLADADVAIFEQHPGEHNDAIVASMQIVR